MSSILHLVKSAAPNAKLRHVVWEHNGVTPFHVAALCGRRPLCGWARVHPQGDFVTITCPRCAKRAGPWRDFELAQGTQA